MTPLRQRMIREMQLRQFSKRTIESYVDAVLGLANHYHRSPDQLALEEVRSYVRGGQDRGHFGGHFQP